MDYDEFSKRLAEQWPKAYGKHADVADDFERDFVNGIEKGILIRLHYPEWMERPRKQRAWITLADRFGVPHNNAIHGLGVRKCARLLVKPSLKRDILSMLNRRGVCGASLGLADACVETIADELADLDRLAEQVPSCEKNNF
jgi:hypothetical protein